MFRRADTIWLVLDTTAPISMDALNGVNGSPIRERSSTPTRDGAVIRFKLDRPQLVSLTTDENSWIVTVSDTAQMPQPLTLLRENTGTPKSGIAIPLENAGRISQNLRSGCRRQLHRRDDVGAQSCLPQAAGLRRTARRSILSTVW